MIPTIAARLLLLVGAAALASSTALAQASVAGNWALDIDSPQGATKAVLTLVVKGDAVTGSLAGDTGETKLTGTVKDGTVTFAFDFAGPQGAMTITTKATVAGDEMKGEMDYGMGSAPFTGKRTAP